MSFGIKVDAVRGTLKPNGRLFAGGKTELAFSGCAAGSCRLGLFVLDRRVYDEPTEPRTRVFPPPGFKCVALSEKEGTKHYLDLDTEDVKDLFSDGTAQPGSFVVCRAYVWEGETPKVVAEGLVNVTWTPVYFTPDKKAASLQGPPGAKGDAGRDAIVTPMTPGTIPQVDATGRSLEPSGLDMNWLTQRVTVYPSGNEKLVFTTGGNPTL